MYKMFLHFVCVLSILSFVRCKEAGKHPDFRTRYIQFPQEINTNNSTIQNTIVKYHNYFRSIVYPSASNMLTMTWHQEAASDAQRWAERCEILKFDSEEGRRVPVLDECGQNVYASSKQVPWAYVIKYWLSQQNFFQYDSMYNDPAKVSAYTQLVWATSQKVGCGVARCPNNYTEDARNVLYNYVCNYCPRGNYQFERPYRKGPRCGYCPKSCSDSGRLCTNPCPYVNEWSNCEWMYNQNLYMCYGSPLLFGMPYNHTWVSRIATCECWFPNNIYERML